MGILHRALSPLPASGSCLEIPVAAGVSQSAATRLPDVDRAEEAAADLVVASQHGVGDHGDLAARLGAPVASSIEAPKNNAAAPEV